MLHNITDLIANVLSSLGYWAVFIFVGIESTGIPFPGETMLIAAAIVAGTTHHLQILFVIIAAASGAIVGDNIGFFAGYKGGFHLIRRYGKYIRVDERRLKLGQYLFRKHGGKVVFFGRFLAILRALAAFLAGTNRMEWKRFLVFNAAGGITWATIFGLGGYLLGDNVHRLEGPVGYVTAGIVVVFTVGLYIFLQRNEKRLADEAERMMPGPLKG